MEEVSWDVFARTSEEFIGSIRIERRVYLRIEHYWFPDPATDILHSHFMRGRTQ